MGGSHTEQGEPISRAVHGESREFRHSPVLKAGREKS